MLTVQTTHDALCTPTADAKPRANPDETTVMRVCCVFARIRRLK